MNTLLLDLRHAARSLTHTPGLALLVLLTLTIGIGATTAIFSTVNEVMLRPLTFRDPGRLVMLWESNDERGWQQVHAAPANVLDWRDRVRAFEDVAIVSDGVNSVALWTGSQATPLSVGRVSGNAFSLLGAPMHLGRVFTFDESWTGSEAGVVLGYQAWRQKLGADSGVIGRTIRLDGVPYRVLGVLAPNFRYAISEAEAWTTFRWSDAQRTSVGFRRAHIVRAIARLAPGASAEQARDELTSVARALETEYPGTNRGMKAGFTPLQHFLVGDQRHPLLLLLGAVGLLQLIVCANVANLLLGRALARRHEMAVRRALGARPWRIARQVLSESFLLAGVGSALGVLLASVGLDLLAARMPDALPDVAVRLDWRMLLFTLVLAGGSALLFGSQPALRSARVGEARGMGDGARTGSVGRRTFLAAHGLVALEVALAVMLVAGAGLMIRSLMELRRVDSGINESNVLTFEVAPPAGLYQSDEARAAFAQRFAERVKSIPGVRDVGVGRQLPFGGFGWSGDFTLEGWPADRFGVEVRHRQVTDGYFRALEVPVVDGTLLGEPTPGVPFPVLVNRAFVDRHLPNENPVGRRITFTRTPDSNTVWHPIVGVVGNERMSLLSEPEPEIIAHLSTDVPALLRYVVKTTVPPRGIIPQVHAAAAAIDREVPVTRVRTMREVALDAMAGDRFVLMLLVLFGGLALLLAAVGVYGVASQVARARTREIGIRIALGASSREVAQTLLARGLLFVGMGVAVGVGGTLAAGGVLRRLLFHVEPGDPVTLVSVVLMLSAVAVVATLIPARRATQLDPAQVLASE
ncbi:MAG TPA: ABC transporter permease [Gemmatimonadaceae bacterium]|nr:ABC transporter permease [Gemmatimonadaceae bacterium]